MDCCFSPHIPDSCSAVSSSSNQKVKPGMESQGIHSRQMAMVLPHHLILLKIPALDHLVFSTREEIGMPIWHSETPNCINMPCERNFERPISKVPKLNGSIAWSSDKELVHRVYCNGSHPAIMPRNNSLELPWGVPLDIHCLFVS